MQPHAIPSPTHEAELHAAVHRAINKEISDTDRPGIIYGIISQASKFYGCCPEDFCVQSACWYEGHAVFGGSNRMHWSAVRGFYPDTDYCTDKFLKQFEGDYWEKVGQVDVKGRELVLVDATALNLDPGEVLPRVRVPIAWNGPHTILGRKSKKGDGKLAEVRIITGVEA